MNVIELSVKDTASCASECPDDQLFVNQLESTTTTAPDEERAVRDTGLLLLNLRVPADDQLTTDQLTSLNQRPPPPWRMAKLVVRHRAGLLLLLLTAAAAAHA